MHRRVQVIIYRDLCQWVFNCDNTEQIGKKIQEDLKNVCFHEVKIKRSLKINNFKSMYNSVKVDDNKVINIKPTALFLRLIAIAQRTSNIEDYFHYELTAYPMSLFKNGLMRKPRKALLRNALLTKKVVVQENSEHVLDGGALLHKVRWSGCTNFGDVCEQYVKYVKKKHTTCIIVFNGYSHVSSTKDHEHVRRSAKQSNTEVHFTESTKCRIKQDVFLANGANK